MIVIMSPNAPVRTIYTRRGVTDPYSEEVLGARSVLNLVVLKLATLRG